MHTPERKQAITFFLLVVATLSAIQVSGSVLSFVQGANKSVLNIQPSGATISAGGFAKFSVVVVGNSSSQVFLHASQVPPGGIAIFTPNAGIASPTLNSSLTVITSTNTPPGTYVVTAVAIVNGVEYTSPLALQVMPPTTSTTNTTMTSAVGPKLSMTVSTNQPQYEPNSTISIQGQVTDNSGSAVPNAAVSIQVDGPKGIELFYTNRSQTDPAGIFQAEVTLPAHPATGTYTVFASSDKPGYTGTATRTAFVVGASTTPSVIIKAVYAGDSAGKPTSTFTTGQAIWIWIVIQSIGTTFQGVIWLQVRDPNGVPVQIQIHVAQLGAGQIIKDGLDFTLPGHSTLGVYTVNALVSDKLISQGGTFLASSETQFALIG